MTEEKIPIELPSLQGSLNNKSLAGFWIRFAAAFIDGMIITICQYVLIIPFVIVIGILGTWSKNGEASVAADLITGLASLLFYLSLLGLMFSYHAWFNKNKGGTLGKLALGLRVVDFQTGQNLSYGKTFIRGLGYFIAYMPLGIGLIVVGFREDKRGWHDLIANTQVIKIK